MNVDSAPLAPFEKPGRSDRDDDDEDEDLDDVGRSESQPRVMTGIAVRTARASSWRLSDRRRSRSRSRSRSPEDGGAGERKKKRGRHLEPALVRDNVVGFGYQVRSES